MVSERKTFLDLVEELEMEKYYKAKVIVNEDKIILEIPRKDNDILVSSLKDIQEIYVNIRKEKPPYTIRELKLAINSLFDILIKIIFSLTEHDEAWLLKIISWAREKE